MSESKFTPGPWEFGTFAAGLLVINESIGKHSPVAQVGGSDLRFVDDSDYANAKLISAAPELLSALERCELLLRTKRHACEDNNLCHMLDSHISQARAAINKATA